MSSYKEIRSNLYVDINLSYVSSGICILIYPILSIFAGNIPIGKSIIVGE